MGIEPTTYCMGSSRSTSELHPRRRYVRSAWQLAQTSSHFAISTKMEEKATPSFTIFDTASNLVVESK